MEITCEAKICAFRSLNICSRIIECQHMRCVDSIGIISQCSKGQTSSLMRSWHKEQLRITQTIGFFFFWHKKKKQEKGCSLAWGHTWMGTMANILSISPKENQPVLPTFMCSFFLFPFNEKADFRVSTLCFPPVLGFRLFQVTSKFSKFNWLFKRKFSLKDDDNTYSVH